MTEVSQGMHQGKSLKTPAVVEAATMTMVMVTAIHHKSPKKKMMMMKKKLWSFLGLLDLNMKHLT
jgi:hypothetical protein